MKWYYKVWEGFLDVVFPRRCACCGKLTEDGVYICPDCHAALPNIDPSACRICGYPGKSCECKRRNFLFNGFCAPFYNKGVAKDGVYRLKFKGDAQNKDFFAQCMANRVLECFGSVPFDAVCYVPATKKECRGREYYSPRLLAAAVARQLELPLQGRLLYKVRENLRQHDLEFAERVKNVQNAFAAHPEARGKVILLIDDIRTTGATLNECAKQLLLQGAKAVFCSTALLTEKTSCKPKKTVL